MADRANKLPQNSEGKFFVDDQCIACDACVIEAPDFFEMNCEDGHAFVKKQPANSKQLKNCLNALEECPVEAIGCDD